MRLLLLVSFSLTGLVFACPKPDQVLSAVKSLGVPISEVKKIEPYKDIPVLCRAVGVLKKGDIQREVDFYTTADGKYLLPFLGRIEYKPSQVKGLNVIKITSVRNGRHSFILGYTTEDGKFYVPELVPLSAPNLENKEVKEKPQSEHQKQPDKKEQKGLKKEEETH